MGELENKQKFVSDLASTLRDAKGIYLTNSHGVDSNSMNALRKKLREHGVRYLIAKNRLAKRALAEIGIEQFKQDLKGPTSIVIAKEDAVAPAKILTDFALETKDLFKVKSCFVEGTILTAKDVERLAKIPSREVLLSQLLSVLNAPMRNLASALSGVLRNVVNVLDAVAKKKAQESQG